MGKHTWLQGMEMGKGRVGLVARISRGTGCGGQGHHSTQAGHHCPAEGGKLVGGYGKRFCEGRVQD